MQESSESHINPIRKIIHVDADAFYASVEERDNPSLKSKPIAVGGRPDSRGVVATCNYIAREFGIHSAMPSATAQRLCPDLIFIKPDFKRYRHASRAIHEILHQFTDLIEPLSLDEAYLDVTNCQDFKGSATLIAQEIRRQVREQLSLTVSAGVAPNKFLAKVASDWEKPDGLFVIRPDQVNAFVTQLDVKHINGVGKVTAAKLENLGVKTCHQLQALSLERLEQQFGKQGKRLYQYARGIDHRPVSATRERKSMSVEHTYDNDLIHQRDIAEKVHLLCEELEHRAQKLSEDQRIYKRFVKVKFANFAQTTMEETLKESDRDWQNPQAFSQLVGAALQRSDESVRLLGLGIRLAPPQDTLKARQLDMFIDSDCAAD